MISSFTDNSKLYKFLFSFLIFLSTEVKLLRALNIINLDAPSTAFVGETIKLTCSFKLYSRNDISNDSLLIDRLDESLYAVKWYLNRREFYRYIVTDWPKKLAIADSGLDIDLDFSDEKVVSIRNVSLKASGTYKCEVSTEAPVFITKYMEKKTQVYSISNKGPSIKLEDNPRTIYNLNSNINLTCTSAESKPATRLDWFIGDSFNLTEYMLNRPNNNSNLFKVTTSRKVKLKNNDFFYGHSDTSVHVSSNFESLNQYGLKQEHSTDNYKQFLPPSIVKYIDSLPEISISTLNFAITNELVRTITEGSAKQIGSKFNQFRHSNTNNQKDFNPYKLKSKKIMSLKIKCISKVLHMSMNDEIKLKLELVSSKSTSIQKKNNSYPDNAKQVGYFFSKSSNSRSKFLDVTQSYIVFSWLSFLYVLLLIFTSCMQSYQ